MPTARPQGVVVTATMLPYPIDGTGRTSSISDELALERSVRLFAQVLSSAWRAPGQTGGLEILQQLNHALENLNQEHSLEAPAIQQTASTA